ncbi:MAG: hypothetical protein AAF721_14920 [Myxococcota bacterium]
MAMQQHVVESEFGFSTPFECESCGHRATARLAVKGTGLANESRLQRNATEVAAKRAATVAQRNASRLVNLIPCPHCNTVGASGARRWRNNRLGFAAVLGAIAGVAVVGALSTADLGLTRLGWVAAIGCALVSAQMVWQAIRPPAVRVSFSPA